MLSRKQAVERANAHLQAEGSSLVALAKYATRNRRYGVWIVGPRDPAEPDEMLYGGGLVVTDGGDVHGI